MSFLRSPGRGTSASQSPALPLGDRHASTVEHPVADSHESPRTARIHGGSAPVRRGVRDQRGPADDLLPPHLGILIQENAAPAAARDLEAYFERIAPEGGPYEHDDEGPDDMPAHLRSALTATQLSIPLSEGRPMLGTWQGIYLFEHRRTPHQREIALHVIGE